MLRIEINKKGKKSDFRDDMKSYSIHGILMFMSYTGEKILVVGDLYINCEPMNIHYRSMCKCVICIHQHDFLQ